MKRITAQNAKRLIGLAHEMEELANRLRDETFREAADVRRISRMLGETGRALIDTLRSREHSDAYKKSLRESARHGPGSS